MGKWSVQRARITISTDARGKLTGKSGGPRHRMNEPSSQEFTRMSLRHIFELQVGCLAPIYYFHPPAKEPAASTHTKRGLQQHILSPFNPDVFEPVRYVRAQLRNLFSNMMST